jgi:hypothetical protein
MKIEVLSGQFSVSRLDPASKFPDWALESSFYSISRTASELSVVSETALIPPGIKTEGGWRMMKVEGILDFGLTGILSSITTPLALAKISIFAVSTYDTDYVLVKEKDLIRSCEALRLSGFEI